MKNIFIIILIVLNFSSYSQNSDSLTDNEKINYFHKNSFDIQGTCFLYSFIDKLKEDIKRKNNFSDHIGSELYNNRKKIIGKKSEWGDNYISRLDYIYDLDVLGYYQLHDIINTELKKKVFIKTDDYKNLYDSLIEIKRKIFNNTCYLEFELPYASKDGYFDGPYFSDYDLKKSSIPLIFNFTDYDYFPKCIYYFDFSYLPFYSKKTDIGFNDIINVPLSNEDGLIFENSELTLLLLFKIDNIEKKVPALHYNFFYIYRTSSLRIIIYKKNKSNDSQKAIDKFKILYDKTYQNKTLPKPTSINKK